jgi:tetratricopeptide (TPR) repeat protein
MPLIWPRPAVHAKAIRRGTVAWRCSFGGFVTRRRLPARPNLLYDLSVNRRLPLLLGLFAALVLLALGLLWLREARPSATAAAPGQAGSAPERRLPPERPRLGEGPDYDNCLALLRDDPEEAMRFAQAWDATGGGDGALHCAALALIGLGEPDRAAESLERIGASSRAGGLARAAVYGQAAQAWMMAGDANRAFGAATLALTMAPNDPDLMVDRAVIQAALARYGDALDDLDRALALEPDRVEAMVFRAAALRHLDRAAEALNMIERALNLSPDNAEALLERGILRQLRGDADGARRDWERTIIVAPESMAASLAAQNIALSELGPARR